MKRNIFEFVLLVNKTKRGFILGFVMQWKQKHFELAHYKGYIITFFSHYCYYYYHF